MTDIRSYDLHRAEGTPVLIDGERYTVTANRAAAMLAVKRVQRRITAAQEAIDAKDADELEAALEVFDGEARDMCNACFGEGSAARLLGVQTADPEAVAVLVQVLGDVLKVR